MKLYEGAVREYKKRHDKIWPELVADIKEHGAKNYSIYFDEATNQLFSYLEIEDEALWKQRAGAEITKRWWDYMADLMETNEDNSPVYIEIPEVFHLD